MFIDGQNLSGLMQNSFSGKQVNYDRLRAYFQTRGDVTGVYVYFIDALESDDPERKKRSEGWQRFLIYLSRHGYRVRTKRMKEIHGATEHVLKGNMDVEIATDAALIAARGLVDEVILVSGDSDFAYLLQQLQDIGLKTVVLFSLRGVSREVRNACDEFVAIEDIGVLDTRRIATEIPQITEGAIPSPM